MREAGERHLDNVAETPKCQSSTKGSQGSQDSQGLATLIGEGSGLQAGIQELGFSLDVKEGRERRVFLPLLFAQMKWMGGAD